MGIGVITHLVFVTYSYSLSWGHARVWERNVERVLTPLPRPQMDSARLSRTLNAEEIEAIVRSEPEGDESYMVDEPSLQESIGDRDSVGPHRSSGGMQVWVRFSPGPTLFGINGVFPPGSWHAGWR